jgi:hypothetical protein
LNIFLMKTFVGWAQQFLHSHAPFVAIDQHEIDVCYANLSIKERKDLLEKARKENGKTRKWGYVKKCFDSFYDEMKLDDLVVIGTGDKTTFDLSGIVRIRSKAYFTPESPRHRRDVEVIWTGRSIPVEKWRGAKRLKKLTTVEDIKLFVDIYSNYLNITETRRRIVAQQGEGRFLVSLGNEQGSILDINNKIMYAPMFIHSILARGYWEEYEGNHDLEELLRGVMIEEPYENTGRKNFTGEF